jgi:hypothetical protein
LAAVETVGVAAADGVLAGGVETATIWAGRTERRSRWLANQNEAPAPHRPQRQNTSTLRLRCTVGPPKRQLRVFCRRGDIVRELPRLRIAHSVEVCSAYHAKKRNAPAQNGKTGTACRAPRGQTLAGAGSGVEGDGAEGPAAEDGRLEADGGEESGEFGRLEEAGDGFGEVSVGVEVA